MLKHRGKLSLLFLFFILPTLLVACETSQNFHSSPQKLSIDPSIQGKEREVIEKIMLKLPATERDNVVYMDKDGNIYSNREKLRASFYAPQQVGPNTFLDQHGNKFKGPSIPHKLGMVPLSYACNVGNGAFRRVSTKAGLRSTLPGSQYDRYAYASVTLTLPSSSTGDISLTNEERGYVTFGGWGASPDDESGNALDAGLQYTPMGNFYSIYILRANPQGFGLGTVKYKPGQTDMKFYVVQDNQVAVSISGTPVDPTDPSSETVVLDANGWNYDGQGNVIKRVTSIATGNQASTSYFKNVEWYNAALGASRSQGGSVSGFHLWGGGLSGRDIDDGEYGICNNPVNDVSVDFYTNYWEIVSIDLAP